MQCSKKMISQHLLWSSIKFPDEIMNTTGFLQILGILNFRLSKMDDMRMARCGWRLLILPQQGSYKRGGTVVLSLLRYQASVLGPDPELKHPVIADAPPLVSDLLQDRQTLSLPPAWPKYFLPSFFPFLRNLNTLLCPKDQKHISKQTKISIFNETCIVVQGEIQHDRQVN